MLPSSAVKRVSLSFCRRKLDSPRGGDYSAECTPYSREKRPLKPNKEVPLPLPPGSIYPCPYKELKFISLLRERPCKSFQFQNMSVEENWRVTRPTIRQKTVFLLNSGLFSDVNFVVRKVDGGNDKKEVIAAHKFLLSIGSPVFEAMFFGELAETRDSIELPDCEYESVFELFRYMYSDEVNLSGNNVMEVLYLAKKYMVPSLAVKCTEYLQDNLDPSNVFSILPSAQRYEEKILVDQCWKVIDEQTEAAVKSDGFATIERTLLEVVVKRDTVNIPEVELFKGVVEWANKQSEKRGIAADGQEIRRILGEKIVKAIRFPVMEQEEFASVVLDSELLTFAEVSNVIKCMNSVQCSPVVFPVTRRRGTFPIRCYRFNSVKFGWSNEYGTSCISFSVDRDVLFHGVYLFGSEDKGYSVALSLISNEGLLGFTDGTFLSTPHTSGRYYGFDVMFKKPVLLKKSDTYCLECRISGPVSWFGTRGRLALRCAGVTFILKDPLFSADGTDTTRGQFNQFIFSHCK